MKNKGALFIVFLFSAITYANPAALRCAGGEGPKPMADITKNLNFKVRPVEIPGTMQEYLVAETKNSLIYREQNGEIRGQSLDPQSTKPDYLITNFSQPISRVMDPQGRYITSLGDRVWVYDSWSSNWAAAVEKPGVTPLFWASKLGKDVLVSYTVRTNSRKEEIYDFYASRYGEFQKEPICSFTQSQPGNMRPVRGTGSPNFYFYNVTETPNNRLLSIHALNTLTCRMEKGIVYEGIRHPVKEVTWFDKLKAVAVRLEDEKQNLLWWSPNGCNYYDVGNAEVMVPNYNAPILVTWSPGQTLNIIYPDKAEIVKTLDGLPISSLKESDLWLTDNMTRLYMGTSLVNEPNRWLLQLEVAQ